MKTAIINSDTSENHNTGNGHPEQIKEYLQLMKILKN